MAATSRLRVCPAGESRPPPHRLSIPRVLMSTKPMWPSARPIFLLAMQISRPFDIRLGVRNRPSSPGTWPINSRQTVLRGARGSQLCLARFYSPPRPWLQPAASVCALPAMDASRRCRGGRPIPRTYLSKSGIPSVSCSLTTLASASHRRIY